MRLVEKYRPQDFLEVIDQHDVIQKLQNILSRPEDVPHLIFVGPPGTGKTTVAICFAKALLGENWRSSFIELNASDERGIEVVRDTIKKYASLMGRRIIFLGESDRMTPDAQHAMRRIMERTVNTIFILDGNEEHKYIDAILSRCAIFRFHKIVDKLILKRIIEICKKEGIKVDFTNPDIRNGFEQLVKDSHGDMRSALNNLEKLYNEKKEITPANVIGLREPEMLKVAIQTALAGDFEKAKQIVEDEYIMKNFNSERIFNDLYHALDEVKDEEVKIRLYEKLAELESNVKLGNSPLIQFMAFVAFCWIAPHLNKRCPILKGEQK